MSHRRSPFASPDAFRSLPPPSSTDHPSSSDNSSEDVHLHHPLSPPRPFFLAGSRNSWSSVNDSLAGTSDSEPDRARPLATQPPGAPRPRNHHRRRSTDTADFLSPAAAPNPFATPADTPTSSLYVPARPPPSAFPFPFQSHPGNPDPGTPIPGMARRASLDSFRGRSAAPGALAPPPGYGLVKNAGQSFVDLARPYAPFMADPSPPHMPASVYRTSAAAAITRSTAALALPNAAGDPPATIPRTSSVPTIAMRAPFLSPSSRPSSSLWSPPPPFPPPLPSTPTYPPSTTHSLPAYPSPYKPKPTKSKPPMPSSRLPAKLTPADKPWLLPPHADKSRAGWWATVAVMMLGVAAAGAVCFFGWGGVKTLGGGSGVGGGPGLCVLMDEEFEGGSIDPSVWTREVELGGFGNGEFEMATNLDENAYVQDGELYIVPTLTSDEIGADKVLDGGTYTLDGCTTQNASACTATSSAALGTVINPVKSARLTTQNSFALAFGKVEVRAKLPRGDWLWPAIWMLPVNESYGPWPLSGEIDIMEARGNAPTYPAQGSNVVRSTLTYGPLPTLLTRLFGWFAAKRFSFADGFHVYAMEWTGEWVRFYVDSRLQATVSLSLGGGKGKGGGKGGGKSFWERGAYPATARNGSEVEVVVEDVWAAQGGGPAAPFDRQFYLILDLAVGGTSGWFPDKVGGKPWFDGSASAMRDFAGAQGAWSASWPGDVGERAFRIDYVKMWTLC